MNFLEYQNKCKETASKETGLQGWTLGLCGETGEFADIVKKYTEHGVEILKSGKSVDDAMEEELGDILYYVAILCDYLGFNIGDVARKNNEKLAARYPNGFQKGGGVG